MRKSIAVFLFAAFAVTPPLSARAALVTIPTGLNPGDQYRLAILTTTVRDATSSNILDYNAFVTADANAIPALAALGTSWSAIASTSGISAQNNTLTNPDTSGGVAIYNLADHLVAANNADLWSGHILTTIVSDSSGLAVITQVWTGTDAAGLSYFPLGRPTSVPANDTAITGSANFLAGIWISRVNVPLGSGLPFYALSDILTVPVPEPSAGLLAVIAGVILLWWRKRA